MNVQIDSSKEEFGALVAFLERDARFNKISEQIQSAIALEEHKQENDVPKEGDDPFVVRSE